MATVTVQLFATLREVTGTSRLTVEASSVREVLSLLVSRYGPELGRRLMTPAGEVQETIAVLVNGRNVRFLRGLDTPLSEGDSIPLIPPVAGGAGGQTRAAGAGWCRRAGECSAARVLAGRCARRRRCGGWR